MLTLSAPLVKQINPHSIGYYDDKGYLQLVNLNAAMGQMLEEEVFTFAKHMAQMIVWKRIKRFAEEVYGINVYSIDVVIDDNGYIQECVDIVAYDNLNRELFPLHMSEDIPGLFINHLADDMFFWFVSNTEIHRWTNTPFLIE